MDSVSPGRVVVTIIAAVSVVGVVGVAPASGSGGAEESGPASAESVGGAPTGEALYPQEVGGDPSDTSAEDAEEPLDMSEAGALLPAPGEQPASRSRKLMREPLPLDPTWLAGAKARANANSPTADQHPPGVVGSESAAGESEEGEEGAGESSEVTEGAPASAQVSLAGELIPDPTRILLNRPGARARRIEGEPPVTPPDTTGAAGPQSYIEATNGDVVIDRRSNLKRVARASLRKFLAARPEDFVTDPQIQWDPQAGRWFYVAIREREERPHRNYLAVGWSKTANPKNLTSDWCHFFLPRTSGLDDFPKLGHNNSDLIIGTNLFSSGGEEAHFESARITTVSKPPSASTRCHRPSFSRHDVSGYTPVPANTFGSSADGYVAAAQALSSESETGGFIDTWDVTGSAQTPTITELTPTRVSPYSVPPDAAQPGTSRRLDTLDARLTQAVAMPDPEAGGVLRVWTQHTVADNEGRSEVQWFELAPGAETPVQEGNIEVPGKYAFNAAVSPATNGTSAMIDFNVSGAETRPEIHAMSRSGSAPRGQMSGDVTLGTSLASDVDFSCFGSGSEEGCRWGDYAGASPDPTSATSVWGSSQVLGKISRARSEGHPQPYWRTRNFELEPRPEEHPPTVLTPAHISECADPLTLVGEVDPNGTSTTYHFEWGPTNAYGHSTPVASAGSGNALVHVSASVSFGSIEEAARELRYFRLVATNAVATTEGSESTFSVACAT